MIIIILIVLYGACESGNINIIKYIVNRGANYFNKTLWFAGAANNFAEITDYFIECGSMISATNYMWYIEVIVKKRMIAASYMAKCGATNFNKGL